jgi:uncharacterized protein (DUF1684 family)
MEYMTSTPSPQSPEVELAAFRGLREKSVVHPQGNLALIATQWIDSEQQVWGLPGRWAPLPAGNSGLKLTAVAADGIRVNGKSVDGEVIVAGKDSAEPASITFSDTVSGFVIAGHNGGYALRVWDANSDAVQNFGGIDAYPFNPEWVVEARFIELPEATLPFESRKAEVEAREIKVPGEILFHKDGVDYCLATINSGRALQIVFSDATSGVDTYSVGRFLFVAPDASGNVLLDFNRAILPPCGFSNAFNCPVPPKQNRFTVAIEAGEKNVLARDGTLLH